MAGHPHLEGVRGQETLREDQRRQALQTVVEKSNDDARKKKAKEMLERL